MQLSLMEKAAELAVFGTAIAFLFALMMMLLIFLTGFLPEVKNELFRFFAGTKEPATQREKVSLSDDEVQAIKDALLKRQAALDD